MRSAIVRWVASAAVVATIGFSSSTPPAVGATGPGEDAGSVVMVDPLNDAREYTRGDTTSAFTLRLPEGAACPGDSANDGWRVQTFIVPTGTDLSQLQFLALRPASEAPLEQRSLREINGGIYTQQMTQANTVAGDPGIVLGLPPLTFAYFEAGTFPPGSYQIGVACTTPDWVVRRYWNSEIEFESAPEIDPGGMRWTFLGDGVTPVEGDGFPVFAIGVAGAAGLGLLLVGVLSLRRRRSTNEESRQPMPLEELV